jgi:hypothetical protein
MRKLIVAFHNFVNTLKTKTNMKSECDSLFSKSVKFDTHQIFCNGTTGERTALRGGADIATKETRVEVPIGTSDDL